MGIKDLVLSRVVGEVPALGAVASQGFQNLAGVKTEFSNAKVVPYRQPLTSTNCGFG